MCSPMRLARPGTLTVCSGTPTIETSRGSAAQIFISKVKVLRANMSAGPLASAAVLAIIADDRVQSARNRDRIVRQKLRGNGHKYDDSLGTARSPRPQISAGSN